ncbi:heterokaryon incompatibility protein [Colletotrichum scovillei]|uniref:heterokaryon incompatibility protein n=1 Tax=Colletotrichum scovillei TaxID=1209932 RepID=UPI0015C33121|nr:heterokaryon incompatibility protein [Colletotrichum scovillei]KAF4777875.1 heterokaryon incompatibility protein [Colletotrichum scovillei]
MSSLTLLSDQHKLLSSSSSTFPLGGRSNPLITNSPSKRPDPPSKEFPTAEESRAKRRKILIADELYRPSRCYPMLWSSQEIRMLELDSGENSSLLHGNFQNVLLESKQEIRMLELDSGENSSLLHGNFQNVLLESKRARYEALSYTWADSSGDSVRRRPMFIGPYWDIIPITRNCENALRSVRLVGGSSRTLWVDSLCINQDDKEERNAQVALMPQIYATAIGVLAYLGSATDDSDRALTAIFNSMSHRNCGHNGEERKACAECEGPIQMLFSRQYFRRLWVVQEVVLSRKLTLYCGSRSTPWPFSGILTPFVHNSWIITRDKATLCPLRNLLGLMIDTSDCLCKDPRDKVFALLGLASRWNTWPIYPDYKLTVEEVSIGIAAYLTQKCGLGLAVLLFAGANRARRSTLPSWIPDIQVPFRERGSGGNLYERLVKSGKIEGSERSRFDNVVLNMGTLSLQLPSPFDIHIMSRSGYLEVTAIKICNLRSFFTEDGRYRHSFVRPGFKNGPEMKVTLILPKPSRIYRDTNEIDVSHLIQQNDNITSTQVKWQKT